MKHFNKKDLSNEELELLKSLDNMELNIFSAKEIKGLGLTDASYLQIALEKLVKRGLISRIEKGKYCRHNFRNEFVIGNKLSVNGAIAYWSALNLHGLTEQFPNSVFVQSPSLKRDKNVFGVNYRFVKIKPEKFFGITEQGYGNESYRITEVEKTLLDCFDLPQYSGGYEELIRAFYAAKINKNKLQEYGLRLGNIAVLKRMAFLSELFEIDGFMQFQNAVQKVLNKRYSLIDPMGEDNGEFVVKWRVRLNVPKSNLLQIINKMY